MPSDLNFFSTLEGSGHPSVRREGIRKCLGLGLMGSDSMSGIAMLGCVTWRKPRLPLGLSLLTYTRGRGRFKPVLILSGIGAEPRTGADMEDCM